MERLPDPAWRPSYAYLPGQTARHPEDLFDDIKSACNGVKYHDFLNTLTFKCAYGFLQDGFYWESHEVFEILWLTCPNGSAEKTLIQALIQIANMHLKRRMGRENAVMRLKGMAKLLWADAFRGQNGVIYGFKKSDISELMQYNAEKR